MKELNFYCENCGNPVSLRANSCSSCGKTFESVKCPECGFSGKATLFSDGCPTCGYMSSFASAVTDPGGVEVAPGDDFQSDFQSSGRKKNRRALPAWAYTLITVGLVGVLALLLYIYLNLD